MYNYDRSEFFFLNDGKGDSLEFRKVGLTDNGFIVIRPALTHKALERGGD